MGLAHVDLVRARLHREQRQQPHGRAQVQHHARLATRHEQRHCLTDDLGVGIGTRAVEQSLELRAWREDGRVRHQVRREGLDHRRVRVPLLALRHRALEQRKVEFTLAKLLAQAGHRLIILRLRRLGALLQLGLLGRGLVHPVRIVDALHVEHHLQRLACLDQTTRRLDIIRFQFTHLCEHRSALLPLFRLHQRATETVEALGPVGLELHRECRVMQRQLKVLVHALAADGLAEV